MSRVETLPVSPEQPSARALEYAHDVRWPNDRVDLARLCERYAAADVNESEIIGRMARAIYMDTAYAGMPVEPTEEWDAVDERICRALARAAFEAMRDPTAAMLHAGGDLLQDGRLTDEEARANARGVWRAMPGAAGAGRSRPADRGDIMQNARPMNQYLYQLVAGMSCFGNGRSLMSVRAELPGLRAKHPQIEIERILVLPSGGRRYWRWRRNRWRLWSATDDPSEADLAKWLPIIDAPDPVAAARAIMDEIA